MLYPTNCWLIPAMARNASHAHRWSVVSMSAVASVPTVADAAYSPHFHLLTVEFSWLLRYSVR